jgi:transposase
MTAIYQAREGPPVDLTPRFRDRLDAFCRLCEQHRDSAHEKTRALAREFLNDWEAVWIVVAHPYLPLTNNEAERALRHWVIARLLSQGTRTEQGSRAFALLASVIDTCRRRNILPWPYLAKVIAERRKGNPAPPLPAAA